MSHKRKGHLTTSPEWAKHLRPLMKRMFWRFERSAERSFLRAEVTSLNQAKHLGSLEDLLSAIDLSDFDSEILELWVPDRLTFRNQPVASDVAMVTILDKLRDHGLLPDGFIQNENGRLYRYRKEAGGARRDA